MPKATIAMAQVFRELLANARQHGALKGNDGAVNVDWRIRDGDFHLAWRETGPKLPVYDGACEFGFGFKVIELCVRRQLGGDYAVETSAEGWGVSIRFPLVSDLGVSVLASDAS